MKSSKQLVKSEDKKGDKEAIQRRRKNVRDNDTKTFLSPPGLLSQNNSYFDGFDHFNFFRTVLD